MGTDVPARIRRRYPSPWRQAPTTTSRPESLATPESLTLDGSRWCTVNSIGRATPSRTAATPGSPRSDGGRQARSVERQRQLPAGNFAGCRRSSTPSKARCQRRRHRQPGQIPESYRAAHVPQGGARTILGPASPPKAKDPRKSLHIGEVPTPELAPDEAYIAVMASSINFNTVWTYHLRARVDVRARWPASAGRASGPSANDREYEVVGQRRRRGRAAGRLGGAQLEAGRPGHGALQPRRRSGSVRGRTTR